MSKSRTMSDELRNRYAHKRGPNGRYLCRWCGTEVKPPRITFCGDACVHEWRLRTDPGYLRRLVFARDHGVCAECGTDTVALVAELRGLRRQGYEPWRKRVEELGIGHRRGSYWDADHIVPVAEGGGECDLSNIRTLCIPCHQKATAELRKRLRRGCGDEDHS